MSNVTIANLPAATAVNTSDYVPIVQGGVTKRATAAQVSAGGIGANPDVTNSATISISAGGTYTLAGADIAPLVVVNLSANSTVIMPASGRIIFYPITTRPALPALTGAALNPADKTSYCTLSNSNLTAANVASNTQWATVRSTVAIPDGDDRYIEANLDAVSAGDFDIGLTPGGSSLAGGPGAPYGVGWGHDQGSGGPFYYLSNVSGTASYLTLSTSSSGSVLGMFVRRSLGKVWLHDINGWVGSAGNASSGVAQDPYTGAGGWDISSLGTVALYPTVGLYRAGLQVTFNFGAGGFHYTGGAATLTVGNGSGTVAFSVPKQVVAVGAAGVSLL